MIEPTWYRICGIHLEPDGTMGAVWMALDTVTSTAHLYDTALFTREVPAVITTAMTARGRTIPVAWRKKDKAMADKLMDAGCDILPDPCADDSAMVEVNSRVIWERLRQGRLKVDKRLGDWLQEYQTFFRDSGDVPDKGFPLMAATRHAIEMLDWARPEQGFAKKSVNYPRVAIV
jgi:hypothetical protein